MLLHCCRESNRPRVRQDWPRLRQDRRHPRLHQDRLRQERCRILGDALSAVFWPPPHLQQHTKSTKQRQKRAGELWFTTVLFDVEQDQDDWVNL